MDSITIEWLDKLIRERPCSGAELSSGILQIVFGTRRLVVQSPWRIVSNSDIAVASGSKAELSEAILVLLHDLIVDKVSVSPPFNDLEVHFGNKASLQTFTDSERYENWYFSGGPQEMIIAGPGTLWSCFEPKG